MDIKKISRIILDFFGVFVPSVCFLIIFISFMITIISRYCFKIPVTWSYEVSVLGYMWVMFFGAGKAIENDEHVVFGLVYDIMKPFVQFLFKTVYNIFLVLLLISCFIPCVQSLIGKQMVTGVLKLPHTIAFAPFIYMLAEIIIRSAINVKKAYMDYKNVKGGKAA